MKRLLVVELLVGVVGYGGALVTTPALFALWEAVRHYDTGKLVGESVVLMLLMKRHCLLGRGEEVLFLVLML